MGQLSKEAREVIVQKALNRGSKPIRSIALENNISKTTIYGWLKQHHENLSETASKKGSIELSRSEKFQHLLNTASLDETSKGAYCRQHGLYSHQLDCWRKLFMTSHDAKKDKEEKASLKGLQKENAQLKKELRRKEKALAEASALLLLKKKADFIWGDSEDD